MGEHKVRPYGFLNLNGKHVDLPYPIKSLNPYFYIHVLIANSLVVEGGLYLNIDFENALWFWLNGKKKKRITIPKGRKPIPRKTYKSMAVQLGLNAKQFDTFYILSQYVAVARSPFNFKHILSFRNTARRDASASKMLSYF